MRKHLPSGGQPALGPMVERPRVLRALRSAGDPLLVLAAPSGWGKTVVAAQFARLHSTSLWIAAHNTAQSSRSIVVRIVDHFRHGLEWEFGGLDYEEWIACTEHDGAFAMVGSSTDDSRALVVVDDLLVESQDQLEELRAVHFQMRRAGISLLVNTTCGPDLALGMSDTRVIDRRHLQLEEGEARALAAIVAPERDVAFVCGALRASGGHPALFAALVQQVDLSLAYGGLEGMESAIVLVDKMLESLERDEMETLAVACLMREGSLSHVDELLGEGAASRLESVARKIPLIQLTLGELSYDRVFAVHLGLERHVLSKTAVQERVVVELCSRLADQGALAKAARILLTVGLSHVTIRWLIHNGQAMLGAEDPEGLVELVESADPADLTGVPYVLELWARALLELGRPKEAVLKARVSKRLAVQSEDLELAIRSGLTLSSALLQSGQQEEARSCLEEIDTLAACTPNGERYRFDIELMRSAVLAHTGAVADAWEVAETVTSRLGHTVDRSRLGRARLHTAMLRVLAYGEYARGAELLSSLLSSVDQCRSDRATWRGNLAGCLVECGRLHRANQLFGYVDVHGGPGDNSAFGAMRFALDSANCDFDVAARHLESAFDAGVSIGHETDIAVNRLYESCGIRAAGHLERALEASERAYSRLAITNHLGYRRLAAIEVAANLLALGDMAAARRWLEPLVSTGFDGNEYHALRADLVLAVCDCREGCRQSAVDRVAAHADHILTESSNWQLAMYIRAFPELIGVLAAAIGAAAIPIHLIRMVPAEYAERGLSACIGWLDPDEWRSLASRTLGDEEFVRFERMGGRPLCHVRMLGGLEVTIGERVIRERDWRKSKARLLFAMLASHRGADIPRDQILDALWPHMDEERARSNFYVAWSTMKSTLSEGLEGAGCPYVESIRGRCHILMDSVRLDLDDFEHAVNALRKAEEECDAAGVVDALHLLSNVYRGDLLPGDVYQDWFAPLRDSLRHRFIEAMSRGAEALLELDDPCEALVYARRALQADPLREDIYQLTLRAHIAAGQRSAAIETFLQCRSQLSEELGLDPSTDTMALYDEILAMEECPRRDSLGFRDRAASDAASV